MNVKLEWPHFSQPVKATKAAMLARIEELEQQLASEKQQHQIMDAAYWAAKEQLAEEQTERRRWQENCEREIRRVVELLEERGRLIMAAEDKDAALGALARALQKYGRHEAGCRFDVEHGEVIACRCGLHAALAPDFVQQAIEAAKAKEAEIGWLKEQAKDHAELHLKHLETEAKQESAAREKMMADRCSECGGISRDEWNTLTSRHKERAWIGHRPTCKQAAAQYREALTVVERVKERREYLLEDAHYASDGSPLDNNAVLANELEVLLGDAAQEKKL